MDRDRPANAVVLMVPGFTGSGPGHWQTLWQRERPEYRRVEQRDWDHPQLDEWIAALDGAVLSAADRVVLVGHSLGCITIARWAADRTPSLVGAALLVAPSDVEADTAPPEVRGFVPMPRARLPFPSLLIASSDDPLITMDRARYFAEAWGSRLVKIGAAGHIHTAAGYGPWPEGHQILSDLIRTAASPRNACP